MFDIDPPLFRQWSVEAEVHPRTLRRFLDGDVVRALSRRRIEAAARRIGLPLEAQLQVYEPGAERHKDGPWRNG
jgi:hypothetical protein